MSPQRVDITGVGGRKANLLWGGKTTGSNREGSKAVLPSERVCLGDFVFNGSKSMRKSLRFLGGELSCRFNVPVNNFFGRGLQQRQELAQELLDLLR